MAFIAMQNSGCGREALSKREKHVSLLQAMDAGFQRLLWISTMDSLAPFGRTTPPIIFAISECQKALQQGSARESAA